MKPLHHPTESSAYNSGHSSEGAMPAREDDIFASSSRETVVPYWTLRGMADTSLVIQALIGNHNPGDRFCFFCPSSFSQDTALADHVRYQHAKEIRKLAHNKLDILCFHSCPFCSARFYTKSLLPQHLIQDHCDLFSQLFKKGNSDEYIKCPFCEYKVLSAFENLLSHHVDESHIAELEEYLTANHSINMKSETFIQSFCLEALPETPGLSEKFAQLSTNNHKKDRVKNEKNVIRRGLFTGKENGTTSKPPKVNPVAPEQTPKMTSCWHSSKPPAQQPKKAQVRFATSTPKSHAVQRGPKCAGDYRCGSCKLFFSTNCDLVSHVKRHHNAVKKLLHPLYACGECNATFFKNSFVKRHRRFHHTYVEN